MKFTLAWVLAAVLAAGCATSDVDECRKGDRRRCPGEASDSYRVAECGIGHPAEITGESATGPRPADRAGAGRGPAAVSRSRG